MSDLDVTLEFGGGAELLVGKLKRHEVPAAARFVYDCDVTDLKRVFSLLSITRPL